MGSHTQSSSNTCGGRVTGVVPSFVPVVLCRGRHAEVGTSGLTNELRFGPTLRKYIYQFRFFLRFSEFVHWLVVTVSIEFLLYQPARVARQVLVLLCLLVCFVCACLCLSVRDIWTVTFASTTASGHIVALARGCDLPW